METARRNISVSDRKIQFHHFYQNIYFHSSDISSRDSREFFFFCCFSRLKQSKEVNVIQKLTLFSISSNYEILMDSEKGLNTDKTQTRITFCSRALTMVEYIWNMKEWHFLRKLRVIHVNKFPKFHQMFVLKICHDKMELQNVWQMLDYIKIIIIIIIWVAIWRDWTLNMWRFQIFTCNIYRK